MDQPVLQPRRVCCPIFLPEDLVLRRHEMDLYR